MFSSPFSFEDVKTFGARAAWIAIGTLVARGAVWGLQVFLVPLGVSADVVAWGFILITFAIWCFLCLAISRRMKRRTISGASDQ